jgi:hypothetical protein
MPANHHIDNEAQLIITTWEDVGRDRDFIEAIKKYQKDIQNHPNFSSFNEVVDLSKITGIKLTIEGIKNIGKIASTTDKKEINRKLALIVSSDLAYGLARLYVAHREYAKEAHKEVCVFKNEKDAFEWVKK